MLPMLAFDPRCLGHGVAQQNCYFVDLHLYSKIKISIKNVPLMLPTVLLGLHSFFANNKF